MTHRTHVGCWLAILLPLVLWVAGPIGALGVLWGLWRTCSFTAWLAAAAACVWLVPWAAVPLAVAGAGLAACAWSTWATPRDVVRARGALADRWLSRGCSLDGLRARLISWAYLAWTWSWRGRSTERALQRAYIRSGFRAMEGPPARNELVHVAYEYGALGLGGLIAIAMDLWPLLELGHPVSAAVVAAVVAVNGVSLVDATGRAVGGMLTRIRRWLTGRDGPLFGTPVLGEIVVLVDGDGRGHVYTPRVAKQADHQVIATAILRAGAWYAERHGLRITQLGEERIHA